MKGIIKLLRRFDSYEEPCSHIVIYVAAGPLSVCVERDYFLLSIHRLKHRWRHPV